MTTSEFAEKWNCTPNWVRKRCKEKMIPLAEKKGLIWDIPLEAEKPPCTRHFAVMLLKVLIESSNDIHVNYYPGSDLNKAVQTYKYLSEWNYISKIDSFEKEELDELLKRTRVTGLGLDLINEEKSYLKKYDKKTTKKEVSAKIGLINASYEVITEKQI